MGRQARGRARPTTTVVTKGDGDKVVDGDQVSANIWIGNGSTQKQAYSTYDEGQPQTIPASDDLSPVFKDAILGQTVGSRVAVTATAHGRVRRERQPPDGHRQQGHRPRRSST